jgi:pyruvate dehydrogenase E1 component alpha subunit
MSTEENALRAPDVETISLLDEQGRLDADASPELDDERMVRLYRAMLRARRFDEHQLRLQREGRIGTFAPVHGQEAAQIGAVAAIEESDWFVPAFRESAAALWRGTPMSAMLLYNAGYNEGGWLEEDSRNLPIAIPVASQLPHAVGIGFAEKQRGSEAVVLTFFGDGATSEGDFHEAMNFAGVYGVPVIFLCQNNQWAISTPREHQTASKTLAQKAFAYGFEGVQVDGNDLPAVLTVTGEAVSKARRGDGPTLIEAVTYRMEVHTTADDPSRYRSKDEEKEWAKRDPIERMRRFLEERGSLDEDAIEEMEDAIEKEIDEAWQEAQARMAELDNEPEVIFEHLYASPPPYLTAQREGFRAPEADDDQDDDG